MSDAVFQLSVSWLPPNFGVLKVQADTSAPGLPQDLSAQLQQLLHFKFPKEESDWPSSILLPDF